MARAIVRWSVNGEKSNQTGNAVVKRLRAAGFQYVGTACYESADAPPGELLQAISDAAAILKSPPGGGRLDHLWIYVDNPDEPN